MQERREKESGGDRAAIIRKYAAIPRPSGEDTRLAADRLGITTSRLHQLVRAWVAHGQISLATGTRRQHADKLEAAIAAAEGDIDMSGVPEVHRTEVERRIRLIGRYLRNGARDRATTQAFVKEYGTAYNTFRSALNVWLLSRDPSMMPGASVTAPGRRKGPMIDEDGESAVRQAVEELGRTAGLTAVHRRAAEICNATGLKRPSAPTVYRWLMSIRSEPTGEVHDDAVCLDRVAIDVAMNGEHHGPLTLTLLFGSNSGRILCHRVDVAPPSPASDARVIADLLARGGDGPCVTLEAGMPAGRGWNRLIEVLTGSGISLWYPDTRGLASGTLAFKTFGNSLGGMRIKRLKPTHPRASTAPETIAVVRDRVEEAIAVHNERRSHDVGPLVDQASRSSLVRQLESMAADQSS